MPAHKTAITIPEALLADVDRAASERGESRSRYITRVLAVAVRTRRDAEITRKLDALFAKEGSGSAQARGARDLEEGGSSWTDERW
jgi:metal-responsive CopG/Arc/MetJ family transcriptional regulator